MTTKDDNALRDAIMAAFDESGLSRLQLARQSGVDYSAVHGFVGGSRDMTLRSASRLCKVLGLRLVRDTRKR